MSSSDSETESVASTVEQHCSTKGWEKQPKRKKTFEIDDVEADDIFGRQVNK